MDTGDVITLVSLAITTIVAVVIPYLAFRFALQQEKTRWLREQRAQFYVDLLAEAYAEQAHLEYEISDDETRERMRSYYVDLRLPPAERAKLGARGNVLGTSTVNEAFNDLQTIALQALLSPSRTGGDLIAVRVKIEGALERLQMAIQQDLGTDASALPAGPSQS
jgi:hypothetical protein